jgi:hypothetical protein
VVFLYSILLQRASAVRPFITDDARVVGFKLAQCESWLRLDMNAQQQWHMFAYGPHLGKRGYQGGYFRFQ